MNTIQNKATEFIQSSSFRRNLWTLILVFIGLLLIVKTVLVYKEAVHYKNPNNTSTISVSGTAEEYVKPDTLSFNITVSEEGKDVAEATAKATDKVNKAIAILTADGVNKDDIKLQSYNVSDKYETVTQPCAASAPVQTGMIRTMVMPVSPCQSSNSNITGQILTQVMSVQIRDIEKNATSDQRTKIISDLSAQNIKADGFQFTVYDMDAAQKSIREEAIAKAKADAKKLADDLDIRLGDLTSFSENGGGNVYYPTMMKSAMAADASVASAPELTPGQQKITSNVTLTYSIK